VTISHIILQKHKQQAMKYKEENLKYSLQSTKIDNQCLYVVSGTLEEHTTKWMN